MMNSRIDNLAELKRIQLAKAKYDFWLYCKIMAPDFYTNERPHLYIICTVVQAFWEKRIIFHDGKYRVYVDRKKYQDVGWLQVHVQDWILYDDISEIPEGHNPRRMGLNVPPRHGKSRTMSLFVPWILGNDKSTRMMVGSYNDDAAADFSKYARDHIREEKKIATDNVFSDVFPLVKVDPNASATSKWSILGEPYTYIATGPNGSSTGKGCHLLILDDIVKDAKTALNLGETEGLFKWVTGTLLSRNEKDKDGVSQRMIIPMTRWPGQDPIARFLKQDKEQWYILALPVEENDVMLCEDMFNMSDLRDAKKNVAKIVWMANYYQKIVNEDDLLYSDPFTLYSAMPKDHEGNHVYFDVADSGKDKVCGVFANIDDFKGYVTDVYYSGEESKITEPEAADMIIKNKTINAWCESNNGGARWARAVEEICHLKGYFGCNFEIFHQSDNKRARLLTNTTLVCNTILYPVGWELLWPEYHTDLTLFPRSACRDDATLKNAACDAPDATTGLAEKMEDQGVLFG